MPENVLSDTFFPAQMPGMEGFHRETVWGLTNRWHILGEGQG